MTKATMAVSNATAPRRRIPCKRLLGSGLGIAILVWLLSDQQLDAMWRAVREADPLILAAVFPLIVANMMLRAVRWRPLLGSRHETRYWPVFSALMIGYLANTVLPARAGDLVRIYVLGNEGTLSRSRILATVFIERVLDLAAIVLVLSLVAIASPLPDWLRQGAMVLAAAAVCGIVSLVVIGLRGERLISLLLRPLAVRAPGAARRIQIWAGEFAVGVQRFRRPTVSIVFFSATAAIWLLEIALVLLVAHAFALPLTALDGAVLMLFSLFSSLIPALPGQIGTFELAMAAGLEFLNLSGPNVLPFAFTLHFLLLAGTALMGLYCLARGGLPLLPRKLMKRLEQGR